MRLEGVGLTLKWPNPVWWAGGMAVAPTDAAAAARTLSRAIAADEDEPSAVAAGLRVWAKTAGAGGVSAGGQEVMCCTIAALAEGGEGLPFLPRALHCGVLCAVAARGAAREASDAAILAVERRAIAEGDFALVLDARTASAE